MENTTTHQEAGMHFVADPNVSGGPIRFRTAEEAAAHIAEHGGVDVTDQMDPAFVRLVELADAVRTLLLAEPVSQTQLDAIASLVRAFDLDVIDAELGVLVRAATV